MTGSTNGIVRVWDERPVPARRRVRAAVRAAEPTATVLIDRLEADGRTPEEVADAVEADDTLDPAVTHAALNRLLRRASSR